MQDNKKVIISYTNRRGETADRIIIPEKIWFGQTEYHPDPQRLLDAFDTEKNAHRTFSIQDIHHRKSTQ